MTGGTEPATMAEEMTMPGYTLEEAQALQDEAMADKAEWVCQQGCECEHEWLFTPFFDQGISGVRRCAVICDKCGHGREPMVMQTGWPAKD